MGLRNPLSITLAYVAMLRPKVTPPTAFGKANAGGKASAGGKAMASGKGWGCAGGKTGKTARQAGQDAAMQFWTMCQQMMGQGWGGGIPAWSSTAGVEADVADESINYKVKLQSAYGKTNKCVVTKETITYETCEVEGTQPPQYQSHVTLDGATYAGQVAPSKKKAEQEAAKIAVQEIYPDFVMKGERVVALKRKAEEMEQEMNPKQKFNQALQLILGKQVTKEDTQYEHEGDRESGHKATLTITARGVSFTGEFAANKNDAEHSAAQVALDALAEEIAEKEAIHQAAKKAKNAPKLAKLKEQTLAKKNLQKANKAAAAGAATEETLF